VRNSRNVLRLLLLLAALAIAGAAGESWAEPLLERVATATPASASPGAFEANDAPRQSAFFNVVRAPGLTVAGRVLESGPPTGTLRPEFRPSTDLPLFASSLASSRLRSLERARLAFAHDGLIARSGARSSFSSGLPPPLLA
jgi:hypothetical protein